MARKRKHKIERVKGVVVRSMPHRKKIQMIKAMLNGWRLPHGYYIIKRRKRK